MRLQLGVHTAEILMIATAAGVVLAGKSQIVFGRLHSYI